MPYARDANRVIAEALIEAGCNPSDQVHGFDEAPKSVDLPEVKLPNGQTLHLEVKFGEHAVSERMVKKVPPPSKMIQVNKENGNTREVLCVDHGDGETMQLKEVKRRVGKIVQLRAAFDTADMDGDDQIEMEELGIVLEALGKDVTEEELAHVWDRLQEGRPEDGGLQRTESTKDGPEGLAWDDFLNGLGSDQVRSDQGKHGIRPAHEILDMEKLAPMNKRVLLSLLVDTNITPKKNKELHKGLHHFQKIGLDQFKRMSTDLDREKVKENLRKAGEGDLHVCSDQTARANRAHRKNAMVGACLIGFFTNIPVSIWENAAIYWSDSNGVQDAYFVCNNATENSTTVQLGFSFGETFGYETVTDTPCSMTESSFGAMVEFWAWVLPMILFWIGIELHLLGTFAVRTSCKIVAEYGYRLHPLNERRFSLSQSLTRIAFEMGNDDSTVMGVAGDFGVDMDKEHNKNIMAVMLYTGKIVILSAVIKQIWKLFTPIHIVTWLNGYAAVISSMFWDTLIVSVLLEEAELLAQGVATAPEVFNAIIDGYEKKLLVRRAFEGLDKDHSGSLGKEEIHKLMEGVGRPMDESKLAAAMKEMDRTGDGQVDFREFHAWWLQVKERREVDREKVKELLTKAGADQQQLSDAQLTLSYQAKLGVLRAIAVANGVGRSGWHPTMELLFEHAVECLDMTIFMDERGQRMLKAKPDAEDACALFLSDLARLTVDEQDVAMSVLLLAQLLDGETTDRELELWKRIGVQIDHRRLTEGVKEMPVKGLGTLQGVTPLRRFNGDGLDGGVKFAPGVRESLEGVTCAFRHRKLGVPKDEGDRDEGESRAQYTARVLKMAIEPDGEPAHTEGRLAKFWHWLQKKLLMT
eukprot:COSAG04_NODE_319_length_16893_cov_23.060141_3_plen_865_part_00